MKKEKYHLIILKRLSKLNSEMLLVNEKLTVKFSMVTVDIDIQKDSLKRELRNTKYIF